MRRFKWIEWNLHKIEAHNLSAAEVEAAFSHAIRVEERDDGSYRMLARTPSGRVIWVIWRYNEAELDLLDELADPPIFVITAY